MRARLFWLMLILCVFIPHISNAQDVLLLGSIPVEKEMDSLALAPNSGIAYGISKEEKRLYIFDLKNHTIKKSIRLDRYPRSIAVDSSNNLAYITAQEFWKSGLLYVIDSNGSILKKIDISGDPEGLAINPNTKTAVVSIEKGRKLLVLSTETFSVLKEIRLPHRPELISIDIESNRAIVLADKAGWFEIHDMLLIVDLNTGVILKDIRLKTDVDSLAVDRGKDIAVTVSNNKIMLFDINTGNIVTTPTLPLSNNPLFSKGGMGRFEGVDINQSTHTAVITGKDGFYLLDLNKLTLDTYKLTSATGAVVVDTFRNTALLGNKTSVIEIQLPNPVPVITNLIPGTSRVGEPGFSLKVEGDKFITTSSVQFNWNTLSTIFRDNNALEALVPSTLLTSPGTVPVTVTNPSPDGGISAQYPFTIKYPAPLLQSITPDTIGAKSTDFILKAYGSNFMSGSLLNFNGQDLGTTYVNSGELQTTVPSSLISSKGVYPVVVINVIGSDRQNSNTLNFTVTELSPVITDFTPKSGQAGSLVTITGNNFDNTSTKVSFNGMQATIQSLSQSASGGEIKAIVPAGATTGLITVTSSTGSAQSAEPFTVLSRQDFSLSISPKSVSMPLNGSAGIVVSLQSTGLESFTGLVKLSLTDSPVTASFNTQYISLNQAAIITLSAFNSQLSTSVTITGTSNIDGTDIVRTASLTINPVPPGSTTLSGQVRASKDAKPVKGVTLTIGGQTTVTDDAGNFMFIDPPAGEQILMMDGHTANTTDASYPSRIPVPVTITGGQDNKLPYALYLHEVNTKTVTVIDPTKDTIVTDPDIPNFEMKIPQGVQIIGWDGLPNEKISVKPVAVDRLPIKQPPQGVYAKEIYMYYFFKPGGGTPTQPIPVKMPNLFQANPGERIQLWYYDESSTADPNSNQWKPFGMGTVSDDGRNIIPDAGVGIPKFCCGASTPSPSPATQNPPTGKQASPNDGSCPIGDPVDPYNGIFIYTKNEMGYPSPSMINIARLYKSDNTTIGPFGMGTSINYNHYLQGSGNALTYITPEAGRYILSKNADGTYTNDNYPFLKGAKAYLNTDSTRTLKFKDGSAYEFDANGRLINETDRNSNYVSISRDSNGNITGITDSFGRTLYITNTTRTIGLSIYTLISSISDMSGRTISYAYDGSARLTSVTDPEGNATTYTYDSGSRVVSIKNKRGITEVTNEYDSEGRVIKQTHADGGIFTISYTVSGGTITEAKATEPNGKITTYRLNNAGYLAEQTDAFGQRTLYDRTFAANTLNSVTDPLGRITTYTYDSNGNIATVTDPAGNVTSYEYDLTFNKPTKITDALGNVTTMTYDTKGNLTAISNPKSKITSIAYNANGQPVSVTDALNNTTTFTYDSKGSLIKTTDPLGNSAQMAYDAIGRLIKATDAKGNNTNYVYDQLNRIKEITDALDKKTSFAYDKNSNLLSVTDAKNQTITYTYNVRDKAATMTDQLGKIETYSYDTNDNLTSLKDRKNQVASYTYDMLNRVTRVDYTDGSYATYQYDAIGRLVYINDSISGPISYVYSNTGCSLGCGSGAVDKVIQEITSLGSISYEYDAIGRRKKMQVAGQEAVNYSYDANSRLINLQSGVLNFGLSYDALGRRTTLTLPNGVTTNYSYDNASHLLELKHLNPLNAVLEQINYVYDKNGNRTKMDRLNVAVKLPNAVTNTTYNQANQMITFNDKSITYDANGNMETVVNSCGMTTYTWDARNRLIGIAGFNTDCSPLTANFKYDALGRRIEKTINSKTLSYLYDGLDIIQEIENGTVTVNYIRTLNIDEPLARIKSDVTIHYYQQDALGSVIALTDETGNIRTQYVYDPFGNVTVSGEASDNPFQFTGRENDGTGLLFERNRYLSLELQRYISQDPIRFAGGDVNFYVRVGNNPVNFVDPMGLTKQDQWYGYNDPDFRDYVHKRKADEGIRGDLDKETIKEWDQDWKNEKQPRGKGGKSGKGGKTRGGAKGGALRCLGIIGTIGTVLDIYEGLKEIEKCEKDPCACGQNCL